MRAWLQRILVPQRPISTQEMGALVTLSGGLYAGFSFLGLLLVTLFLGAEQGGVFCIALAISQQVLTIGWFNVRRFQASDCGEQFSFSDYVGTRILTTAMMLLAGGIWVACGSFSSEKAIAIGLFVALKASEAFSDVLAGRYQQKNRFDTSCRILLLKTLLPLGGFVLLLAFARSLNWALGGMLLLHLLLTVGLDGAVLPLFSERPLRPVFARSKALLGACLLLFLSSFLTTYINGAPKYIIDRTLDEQSTAIFSALSMASFAILLLSEFLINPQVTHLSQLLASGQERAFRASIRRLTLVLGGCGLVGLGAVFAVGAPVLSFCFKMDLVPHRMLLCLLFTAGVLMALCQVAQLVLIIVRRQGWCFPGIVVASGVACVTLPGLVRRYALLGAGMGFLLSVGIMLAVLAALALWFMRRRGTGRG